MGRWTTWSALWWTSAPRARRAARGQGSWPRCTWAEWAHGSAVLITGLRKYSKLIKFRISSPFLQSKINLPSLCLKTSSFNNASWSYGRRTERKLCGLHFWLPFQEYPTEPYIFNSQKFTHKIYLIQLHTVFGASNMVKWGSPENIIQNAVQQTRLPYGNMIPQSTVKTKRVGLFGSLTWHMWWFQLGRDPQTWKQGR